MSSRSISGLVLSLVLTLSATAAHADLATAIGDLEDAIENRLTTIGDPPPKEAKKEFKKLTKAEAPLQAYAGVNDKASLKSITKGGKLIIKSGTADPAIEAAVQDILTAMLEIVETKIGLAGDAKALLTNPKFIAAIEKLLAKYAGILNTAKGMVLTDPSGAMKLVLKAYTGFEKAEKKALKFIQKELNGGGGSGSNEKALVWFNWSEVIVQNQGSKPIDVVDVQIRVDVMVDGVKDEDIDVNMKNVDPTLFDNWAGRVFPDGGMYGFDLSGATSWTKRPGFKTTTFTGTITVITKKGGKFQIGLNYSPAF